ncbi:MAG: response regulator [Desulfovibrionaceae bacterium]|jgi:anti-anti-sigma factor|nr:response regulator [Desulfovibrionaceae bacterium]
MKKILVVDDEKPTLELLEMLLVAYGYEVFLAENGQQALEIYRREAPPIVLTDLKMPIMDGMEVLGSIKRINPQAEVIVITGHGDMDLALKALNLDATDFVNKPLQRKALDQALKRAEERILMAEHHEQEIVVEPEAGATAIHFRGNVTAVSEPFIKAAFDQAMEAAPQRLLLLFSDNASINGVGIALLTQQIIACRDRGMDVRVAGVNENLRKVFEIVGISKLATLCEDAEQARKAS